MNVLVTGAAGFIGHHLCARLLKDGYKVVGIDNYDPFYSVEIKKKRISELEKNSNFKMFCGDLKDPTVVDFIFRYDIYDCVYHLAALAGVKNSIDKPISYFQNNVMATINILEFMQKYKMNKIVLASSSTVYGDENIGLFGFNPVSNVSDKPFHPYGASKKSMELMAYPFHHNYGLDIIINRYFSVYGPSGRPDMFIPKCIDAIKNNKSMVIKDVDRAFTYIDDVVDATILHSGESGHKIFNVGSPKSTNLVDVIKTLESICDKKLDYEVIKNSDAFDMLATAADLSNSDWRPRVSLSDGLERTVYDNK
jgi:nucleoside-diphosphate-sugar epimerase